MNDLTPVLMELGREESRDLMNGMKEGLTALQDNADETDFEEYVGELLRHAHTLKGVSRTIELRDVEETAANLERFFKKVRHSGSAGALNGTLCSGEVENLLERLDTALRYIERDQL